MSFQINRFMQDFGTRMVLPKEVAVFPVRADVLQDVLNARPKASDRTPSIVTIFPNVLD
jgi:hypothetical protein